ncbi:SDR family NAD(P)-dependent oxidoreductase [Deinococcus sp. Arct2-2]|uniref:SDR family NAD(P)-dependent oxidoreductase n=1 Tax=Deinococcus sp. Arct2-2 TaxID=2568653 RepID=UPI0023EF5671|nr:SDR family NAD(P)-dependent oxidoreductase [Deinococcus sp. Arct2-2]
MRSIFGASVRFTGRSGRTESQRRGAHQRGQHRVRAGPIPLRGTYSASKHALKGFTDALRMELEAGGAPISVTLVKPGLIDTPFPLNARNCLDAEPQHVPPVYAPETVARAILHAAEQPMRDVFVGGGKGTAAFGQLAPGATDRAMRGFVIPRTKSQKPPLPRAANVLARPSERLAERGDYPGHVQETSVYTGAAQKGMLRGALLVSTGLAGWALWRVARKERQQRKARECCSLALPLIACAPALTPRWSRPQHLCGWPEYSTRSTTR